MTGCLCNRSRASKEFFAVTGVAPSTPEEKRRHVRSHMRVVAALQYRRSLPSLVRQPEWFKIVMRDISRSGISFLHSEQVFPTEQLMLVMPDCKPRCIEVVRCRRINQSCYEVGASYIKRFRSGTDERQEG